MELALERGPTLAHGPAGVDAAAMPDEGQSEPLRVRLYNVKYSPNLGDGLLCECLEHALVSCGAARSHVGSVDLSARTAYEAGSASRSTALSLLHALPGAVRRQAIKLPLALAMRRRWRPHYAAHLEGVEAVVIGGGNLLSDLDLNFPTKVAAALRCAAERGLACALYGVGVGGAWSAEGLRLMREAFVVASPAAVMVRDAASKSRFDDLFADAAGCEASVVRDPGLLVSRTVRCGTGALYAADPRAEAPIGLCITSGVAVRYHASVAISDEQLARWYVRLAGELSARDQSVVVFTNGSPEDEAFLDRLQDRLAQTVGGSLSRQRPRTPNALARLICGMRGLVAHRMHALITAYAYGVPFHALRWDGKVDAFLDSVGLSEAISDTVEGSEASVAAWVRRGRDRVSSAARARVIDEALDGVATLYGALERSARRNAA